MATKKSDKKKSDGIGLTIEQLFDIIEETYNRGFCEGRQAERAEHIDISGVMNEVREKYGKI